MGTYRILPASYEHLGWLRLLYARFAAEMPVDYPEYTNEDLDNFVLVVAQKLRDDPNFGCFVAIIGRRCVGFVGGELLTRPLGTPHAFAQAHWLYVVPRHRGKGVARQLIAAGAMWIAAHNIEVLECFGHTGDDGWARRGFTPYLTKYYMPLPALAAKSGNGLDHGAHDDGHRGQPIE